jgi:hypothetical protein
MFKKLDPQDIVVAGQPIIEPVGSDPGGDAVQDTDYVVKIGNLAGTLEQKQIYRQIANIIQGDSESNLPIGSSFNAAIFERNSFKEALHPATFKNGPNRFNTGSDQVKFTEAGREYKQSGGVGYLYPDVGILLSTSLLQLKANSEIIATNSQVFIRSGASEFNYTTNPSFLSKDDNVRSLDLIYNPRTYITTVGLYNDNGDLLAVAKVPKPIEKSFEKEVLITIELNY